MILTVQYIQDVTTLFLWLSVTRIIWWVQTRIYLIHYSLTSMFNIISKHIHNGHTPSKNLFVIKCNARLGWLSCILSTTLQKKTRFVCTSHKSTLNIICSNLCSLRDRTLKYSLNKDLFFFVNKLVYLFSQCHLNHFGLQARSLDFHTLCLVEMAFTIEPLVHIQPVLRLPFRFQIK